MASFFGGKATTNVTVKPSYQVEKILRDIVSKAKTMPDGQKYIEKQLAALTPDQQSALQDMIDSGSLKQIESMYAPLTEQGLSQLTNIGQKYQDLANNSIGAEDVKDYQNGLQNSALAKATAAAPSKVSLGNGQSTDATRRAALTGSQREQAMTNLSRQQSAANLGISNLMSGQDFQRGVLGVQSGLSRQQVGLGAAGTQAGQQAIQNKLNAGNIQQDQANRLNQLNWQNQLGRQQFGWNQLNNQLNVLNQVSPMAGYSMKNVTPGQSVGQQVLGGGITALGIAGRMGAFSPSAETTNAWGSYNQNGGQQGMQGPMPAGAGVGNISQASPYGSNPYSNTNTGFWGNYGSNILGGVLGAFGAV